MKKDKNQLIKLASAMVLVLVGVVLFGFILGQKEGLDLQAYIWIGIVAAILLFSFVVFLIRWKDVKKGMPLEDERSKKVLLYASSRSFYLTLYWLLALSIFEKFFAGLFGAETLTAGHTVGGGIFGMTIFFMVFWFYYNKKANL